MEAIMHDHLTALLSAGFRVTLEPDYVVAPLGKPRYWAHVEKDGEGPRTAEGSSPAEAVWAASPLHSDDERMPLITDLIAEHAEGFGDITGILREAASEARDAYDVKREITSLNELTDDLHDEMDIITQRVAAIEADKRDLSMMIRMAADLFARAFPGGLVATRGDGPAACAAHPGQPLADCPACAAEIAAAIARDRAAKPAEGVIDSHVWNCAKCGAQCIGPEPEGSVGRCCGGA